MCSRGVARHFLEFVRVYLVHRNVIPKTLGRVAGFLSIISMLAATPERRPYWGEINHHCP